MDHTAPNRPLPVGPRAVLADTWRLYSAHLPRLFLTMAAVEVPLALIGWAVDWVWQGWVPRVPRGDPSDVSVLRLLVGLGENSLLHTLAATAVTFVVLEALAGRRATLGVAYRVALNRFPTLFLVGVLLHLMLSLIFLIEGHLRQILLPFALLVRVASLSLALYLLSRLALVVVVAVAERASGLQSMDASWVFTARGRWRAPALLLVPWIMAGLAVHVVMSSEHLAPRLVWARSPLEVIRPLAACLVAPLVLVGTAVLYERLRASADPTLPPRRSPPLSAGQPYGSRQRTVLGAALLLGPVVAGCVVLWFEASAAPTTATPAEARASAEETILRVFGAWDAEELNRHRLVRSGSPRQDRVVAALIADAAATHGPIQEYKGLTSFARVIPRRRHLTDPERAAGRPALRFEAEALLIYEHGPALVTIELAHVPSTDAQGQLDGGTHRWAIVDWGVRP
jgi:hypothetical protein